MDIKKEILSKAEEIRDFYLKTLEETAVKSDKSLKIFKNYLKEVNLTPTKLCEGLKFKVNPDNQILVYQGIISNSFSGILYDLSSQLFSLMLDKQIWKEDRKYFPRYQYKLGDVLITEHSQTDYEGTQWTIDINDTKKFIDEFKRIDLSKGLEEFINESIEFYQEDDDPDYFDFDYEWKDDFSNYFNENLDL